MKAAAIVSTLATLANAAAVNLRGESPLVVEIEQVGNSEVKASITNTGNSALRVLRAGSILDSSPVEKVKIAQGTNRVPFTGIRVYVHTANLQDQAFQTIGAKETIEVQWDAAQFHDLSAGGDFDVSTEGSLRYAAEGSNAIAGQVVYASNVIRATVDGARAAEVHGAFRAAQKAKRVVIQSDCSSSQTTVVNAALGVARTYAQNAQSAASAGTKMQEYFKSTSSSTVSTVVGVFSKIATSVVNSGTSGSAKLYCTDVGNACEDGVVAYTQPGSDEYIALCPYWFQFPATGNTCHIADQPYVIIHEATHLVAVKGTDDVCYGYDGCVTDISNSQSLNNADSYALYANAIHVGC
ncbi:putative deuterolysin metalloprotease [Rosellinia necatrix]|uniref:Neutral protease 2 n=1 Tax=Rosellinia necatrix TaxID=77044 RepID=A0A1S7UL04_ROSNE|nr:putative deuterolysin metalloprotease [Rosellinia necatrix]